MRTLLFFLVLGGFAQAGVLGVLSDHPQMMITATVTEGVTSRTISVTWDRITKEHCTVTATPYPVWDGSAPTRGVISAEKSAVDFVAIFRAVKELTDQISLNEKSGKNTANSSLGSGGVFIRSGDSYISYSIDSASQPKQYTLLKELFVKLRGECNADQINQVLDKPISVKR